MEKSIINGGTKKKKLSIGVSDFREIITENIYFVDKSLFIKDVVDGMKILLYPRPRRFGKTLNLSMLKYFYDSREDNSHLFHGLVISSETDIMEKQGKHPVIFLTFKDVKEETFDVCLEKIRTTVSKLYREHQNVLLTDSLYTEDYDYYKKILNKTASQADFEESLKFLCQILYEHYKSNPVILIDEYDTPIHAGFYHGYYDKIVNFMRGFLGAGLKDNNYLEKGVLTGILRVSKESIFSDLNNISVYSMLSEISADKFGFTDDEVENLLVYFDSSLPFSDVKNQYNGYNFSGLDVYNPWSILNAIHYNKLGHFWGNTSSNNIIKKMCHEADETVKQDLSIMIEGGKVKKYIDEEIIFPELYENKNALWNFFLMCGYLRYDNYDVNNEDEESNAELSIPNYEIKALFKRKIVPTWFNTSEKTDEIINLAHHLVDGNIEVFKKEFTEYCLTTFSYFDVGGDNPEKFYHGFVLGIFACLKDRYQIRSNRESGLGRYDVILTPNDPLKAGERGIIFEFKTLNEARGETFEKSIEYGRRQLVEQKYAQELQALGIEEIVSIVAVFKGKEVRIGVF
ncbi:MAG: ATP-binding protein [Candidatus Cloacimonetes bacterium]|nr:ATP-binding protein [Candidatus Cloacimonadota bacterium]